MWWLLGAAIGVVLLVVVLALCRVAANADQAASKAFAVIEGQKLHTLAINGRDEAA